MTEMFFGSGGSRVASSRPVSASTSCTRLLVRVIASTRPSGLKAAWPGSPIASILGKLQARGPRTDVPDRVFVARRRHERPAVGTEEHVGAALDGKIAGQGTAASVPDLYPAASPGARGHPASVGAEVQPLKVRVTGEGHEEGRVPAGRG